MQRLTTEQFQGIQNLVNDTLIRFAGVDFNKFGPKVTVIFHADAALSEVDAEIRKIFPRMEYSGLPVIYLDKGDKTRSELHYIYVNGEPIVNLCMKKASTAMEAAKETSHPQFSINLGKVKSLMDRRMAEEILKGEGETA